MAQSRLAQVRCGAELAERVRPIAGPGESSLSAAQSRPPTGRPQRVDFKSRVECQCRSHGATQVILVRSSRSGLRSRPEQAWASQVDFKLSEAARRPGDRHGDSDPEQARASHVRPIAGPGEPSAVQSRPGRVDFKLSVAHSLAGHGPTDSESGRALAWAT